MSSPSPANVAPLHPATETPHQFEQLWGKEVRRHGYAAVPTLLVRAQNRLQLKPTAFCLLVQLIEYWRIKERAPFPSKQQLADRLGG